MNNSDSDSDIHTPRPTLKLKVAPRKSPADTNPTAKPQSKASQKPGARRSDDYMRAMQEDMDRLAR